MFVFVRLMGGNLESLGTSFFTFTTGLGGGDFSSDIRLYLFGFDRRLTVSIVNAVTLLRACRRGVDFGSFLTFGLVIRLFEIVVSAIFESETDSVAVDDDTDEARRVNNVASFEE